MTTSKNKRSVVDDPRWQELVLLYRYDWISAAEVMFGKIPTWQQEEIINAVQNVGSKTTVSSGHGTGKSDMTSIMILCYILFYPEARVVLVANKLQQVKTGIFKYLKTNWKTCVKRLPWLKQYFTLTDMQFFETSSKGSWEVVPKGFRLGNEEALAGEHAEHLLYIIDEASGVSDKAFQIMKGALTQEDNRLLLISQPTRTSGEFYDSHHRLAITPENPDGIYTAIKLNSEESPLVTLQFIREKLVDYGGRESPEYLIKVRGEFPSSISGYLLGRDECERAVRRQVLLAKGWGWVACCDVGNGRDKSVMSIFRISGYGKYRRVVPHLVREMESTVTPSRFADFIFSECNEDDYPNITICIDGDGVGSTTADVLEEKHGVIAQRIRWGAPMHNKELKKRFINQRAYANVMAANAIRQGRMKMDKGGKTADQASKIPAFLNEAGQWVMMSKPLMRTKLNLKSPDHWDTYCFTQLADYVPANEVLSRADETRRNEALDWLQA
ncbi:terminase [Pantoea sp. CCBC3-3-1]|uniref:terminase n=1 Tax=Pantoea sp. CCBC3-3-1 TaxID=2490851 RepID=UPI0011BED397|nr:terminase [Pantoea sp. CCBC3-3-1]